MRHLSDDEILRTVERILGWERDGCEDWILRDCRKVLGAEDTSQAYGHIRYWARWDSNHDDDIDKTRKLVRKLRRMQRDD